MRPAVTIATALDPERTKAELLTRLAYAVAARTRLNDVEDREDVNVSQRWLRILAAIVAFAVVVFIGIVARRQVTAESTKSWALITAIALVVAFMAYAAVEYLQTGRFDSIARQFDTRTIVLMPLAIAINIILGQTVAGALKIPIYLDSIGTILVGVLAGPIPGALTGFLANILWTYVVPPPFQGSAAAAFAIVAAVIGLLAGTFGRLGFMRPRPDRSVGELVLGGIVALAIVGLMAFYAYSRFYTGRLPVLWRHLEPACSSSSAWWSPRCSSSSSSDSWRCSSSAGTSRSPMSWWRVSGRGSSRP